MYVCVWVRAFAGLRKEAKAPFGVGGRRVNEEESVEIAREGVIYAFN